ncbi:MAG: hypothetical protein ABIQ89_03450 [Candidatus Saccharimonadales bacterium]
MERIKQNFIPWNRKWVTFRRHLPVVIKPAVAGLLMVLVWKFVIYDHDLSFAKSAENPLLLMIIPLVGFIYVIFASLAISSVFDEYKTISRCVVKSDLETFLIHRDEQLPIMMHILVGAPSLILVLFAIFFRYEDPYIAVAAIFSVVFMIVITWVIATELDRYEKSIWFKEKIPKDWYEVDVSEYFKSKNKPQKKSTK